MKKPPRVRKIPDWVPLSVRERAEGIYAAYPNGADPKLLLILNRLTSDPPMKSVWTELQKRRRQEYVKTSDFFRPAIAPGRQTSWTPQARSMRRCAKEMHRSGRHEQATRLDLEASLQEVGETLNIIADPRDPQSLQDVALAWFFSQVVSLARHPPKPITLCEVLRLRKPYAAKASRLRADAAKQKDYSIKERLMAAADAYEELGDEVAPRPTNPLVVRRKSRSYEESKGFSIGVIEVTKAIFGQRLLGTVATLANVVFDRTDMTGSKLGKMLTLPR
jgi:hypothetical protein